MTHGCVARGVHLLPHVQMLLFPDASLPLSSPKTGSAFRTDRIRELFGFQLSPSFSEATVQSGITRTTYMLLETIRSLPTQQSSPVVPCKKRS